MKKWDKKTQKVGFAIVGTVAFIIIIIINAQILLQVKMDEEKGNGNNDTAYQYHIAMIGNDSRDVFWQSVYEGARRAGEDVDSYVENFGAGLSKEYTVEELLQMAIAAKVDGIILEGTAGNAAKLIEEADAAEIPVVTVLSDVPGSKRKSFVSANDYALGEMYGNQVVNALATFPAGQEEIVKVTVLMNSKDDHSVPNLIYSGISEAIGKTGKTVDLSPVITSSSEFESEETVRDIIVNPTNRPDVLVCLSVMDTISAYQSVIDYNLVGQIQIIGYYISTEILEGIQKGIIQSAVVIDTAEMGRVSVEGVTDYITKKYVSEFLPVSSTLITREKLERYEGEEEEPERR